MFITRDLMYELRQRAAYRNYAGHLWGHFSRGVNAYKLLPMAACWALPYVIGRHNRTQLAKGHLDELQKAEKHPIRWSL